MTPARIRFYRILHQSHGDCMTIYLLFGSRLRLCSWWKLQEMKHSHAHLVDSNNLARVCSKDFSISMLYQFFSDRKKLTSSGCISCVVCGGNDNMVTPLSRASLMASRFLVCEAWPSRRSRCLFSIEEFTDVMKCFSRIRKQSLSIQPESLHSNIVPAGVSVFKVFQIRFRLNTSMGAR